MSGHGLPPLRQLSDEHRSGATFAQALYVEPDVFGTKASAAGVELRGRMLGSYSQLQGVTVDCIERDRVLIGADA